MNDLRRQFLKRSLGLGAMVATLGSSLLVSQKAFAAYLKDAFAAKDVSTALNAAVGSDSHTPSDEIKLKAPDIAENGAVVPVTVSSTLPNVESISVVVVGNNSPLAATNQLSALAEPFMSTRLKMAKTSDVIAIVKSNGKLYSATKEVKVTIGGCGG